MILPIEIDEVEKWEILWHILEDMDTGELFELIVKIEGELVVDADFLVKLYNHFKEAMREEFGSVE